MTLTRYTYINTILFPVILWIIEWNILILKNISRPNLRMNKKYLGPNLHINIYIIQTIPRLNFTYKKIKIGPTQFIVTHTDIELFDNFIINKS